MKKLVFIYLLYVLVFLWNKKIKEVLGLAKILTIQHFT